MRFQKTIIYILYPHNGVLVNKVIERVMRTTVPEVLFPILLLTVFTITFMRQK